MADAFDQVVQEQKAAQPQGAPGAQVTLPAQSPQPQGNGGQAQSPPSQGQSQSQSQGQPQGDAFDQIAAEQNAQKNALVDIPGGPTAEEQAFLKSNPDHAWVPADPKFPNRPAGIYPTGKGNEWRKDPSYSQAPIDLHFAKHTLEGAAIGAVPVALATGLAAAPEAASALYELAVKHLAGNVLPGMEEEAAKAKLLQMAPKVWAAAKALGVGAGGVGLLWKSVFGNQAK